METPPQPLRKKILRDPPDCLLTTPESIEAKRFVLLPAADTRSAVDVKLDYVGNLDNAALVIARLYHGEKRLVLCDSRGRVEQLAVALRKRRVKPYVTHSSLGTEERARGKGLQS